MQPKDFFQKILSAKTAVLIAMVSFLVIYAVIGVIMLFSSGTALLSSITQILAPLGIIGAATILSVDCFHKMANDEKIVRIFGFITLILGAVDMILLTLMIWEIIPAYESSTSALYGYYYSFFSTPSIAYKITMALLSLTGFTFLSSIVFTAKNNHKLIKTSKYIATGFLAAASLISAVGNFIDSSQSMIDSTRMGLLQAVSWVTAICLGATVVYLSKTISWEERKADAVDGPHLHTESTEMSQPNQPIMNNDFSPMQPSAEQLPTSNPNSAPPLTEQLPVDSFNSTEAS